MPRAPKLKPAGGNGSHTLEEVVSAQQAALALWPANHYSSEIGYECGLAEVLAAMGREDEALVLLNRTERDCWVYHRYRSSYGVALQLIRRGEVEAAASLAGQLDAEVGERDFIGETCTIIRGASASVWHRLGEAERSRLALADAHQAAVDEPSNPTQPWPHLAQAYALCGRFDEALEAINHTRSFWEIAVAQIVRQAVATGEHAVLDRALKARGLDGYRLPELLHPQLDQLRRVPDQALLGVLLPRLLARSREDDVEALLTRWLRDGHEEDARLLAQEWHAHKPSPRSAAALAICGQREPGAAMLAEPPELKRTSQAREWAGLLGALGEVEQAAALWSGKERLSVLTHAAYMAWLAGHRDGAAKLLSVAEDLAEAPLEQAAVGAALFKWGDAAGAAVRFSAARKALAALKGYSRYSGLEALARIHGDVSDLPGGQATATKLRIGNQRDRALLPLSRAAVRCGDVGAAMVLARSMKDPAESVKAIAGILQILARRQGILAPSMLSLSLFWLDR